VPGANGQGETIQETKANLRQAIALILDDLKTDILRGLPNDAIQDTVMIG
jgi:predicted RNase H-like HicB family nuclease